VKRWVSVSATTQFVKHDCNLLFSTITVHLWSVVRKSLLQCLCSNAGVIMRFSGRAASGSKVEAKRLVFFWVEKMEYFLCLCVCTHSQCLNHHYEWGYGYGWSVKLLLIKLRYGRGRERLGKCSSSHEESNKQNPGKTTTLFKSSESY